MTDKTTVLKSKQKQSDEIAVCHNRVSKYMNHSDYNKIHGKLCGVSMSVDKKTGIKDIILRGKKNIEKQNGRDIAPSEKYIVRFPDSGNCNALLIKECSKGNKIKELTEPISHETAMRIIERSTKWLCSSLSPLIRELGVKMTTERLQPDTVVKFDREYFTVDNRIKITADSGIALTEYAGNYDSFCLSNDYAEPLDGSVCLLQVNYERIIPEYISSLIGLRVH